MTLQCTAVLALDSFKFCKNFKIAELCNSNQPVHSPHINTFLKLEDIKQTCQWVRIQLS